MHFPFQVNETVRQSSQKQPGAHLKIIIASQGTKAPYSGFPSQRLKKITQSQLPLIGGVVDRGLLCDHPSCHWILWLHPPPHTSVDPIDLIKFAEENSFPFRFPIHNKWWAHNRSTKDCSFHFIRDGLGCRLPESLIQLESMMPLGQFLFAIRSRRRRWMIESEVAYILLPMFHTDWRWWIGTHISSDHYIVTILLTNSFRFHVSNCPVYRSEQESCTHHHHHLSTSVRSAIIAIALRWPIAIINWIVFVVDNHQQCQQPVNQL